jgi:hypothetical protein
LLGVCDGVHPPFPGYALQFLDALIVECGVAEGQALTIDRAVAAGLASVAALDADLE